MFVSRDPLPIFISFAAMRSNFHGELCVSDFRSFIPDLFDRLALQFMLLSYLAASFHYNVDTAFCVREARDLVRDSLQGMRDFRARLSPDQYVDIAFTDLALDPAGAYKKLCEVGSGSGEEGKREEDFE